MSMCSVKTCKEPASARGWCTGHYQRWNRLGELREEIPLQKRGAAAAWVRDVALKHKNNKCLLWPFGVGRNGYGIVWIDGVCRTVHAEVCQLVNGPRPKKADAAHSCGVRLCANPRHLRWASRKENEADKLKHGKSRAGKSTRSAVKHAD